MFEKAFSPAFEEGRPRRSTNATLPHEVGGAGEVRLTFRSPDTGQILVLAKHVNVGMLQRHAGRFP